MSDRSKDRKRYRSTKKLMNDCKNEPLFIPKQETPQQEQHNETSKEKTTPKEKRSKAMAKFIYKVNEDKKIVFIDDTVKPTKIDEMRYASYVKAEYKTHIKSQKKVEHGKRMAEKNGLGKKKES